MADWLAAGTGRDGRRVVPALIAALSAAALAAALVAQYGFGLPPCELCIWQRWPYVVAGLCGLAGALLPLAGVRRALVALAALAFLANAGLSSYHAGIEYGWWQDVTGCTGAGVSSDVTMDDLEAALSGAGRVVPCDEPALVVLGLSMAGWNALLSLALAAAAGWALAARRA